MYMRVMKQTVMCIMYALPACKWPYVAFAIAKLSLVLWEKHATYPTCIELGMSVFPRLRKMSNAHVLKQKEFIGIG